jgi:hypothetical protein
VRLSGWRELPGQRLLSSGLLVPGLLLAAATMAATASDLVEAARRGDRAEALSLIARGADPNEAAADGTTALHWAVRAEDHQLVQALLAAGSRPNPPNRYGVTPLSLAAQTGNPAIIEALLEAGADVETASREGETVLMTAARTGRVEALRLLLDAGADVNARESWFGETALMWAVGEHHAEAARLLIARGADVNAVTKVVELPEAREDFATMVFTAKPRGGLTPLLLAAREGAIEAVDVLAQAGADLDLADPDRTSPLVMAIINAHYGVAARLVALGADPNVADAAGMGALYALVDMRTQDPLVNRPPAVPTGDVDTLDLLQRLLDAGADANLALRTSLLMRQHNFGDASLAEGATPLMRAAKYADLPALRALLAGGADPNRTLVADGANAAMVALRRAGPKAPSVTDRIEAVRLCLDAGLDLAAVNTRGESLLHQAVGVDDTVVAFLAARGASLDQRDAAGRTPLDVALGVPGPPSGARGSGATPGPAPVRESTAALLRQLMQARGGSRP